MNGQTRMRSIYEDWWQAVENHHGKPVALRLAVQDRFVGFALLLATYLTIFEEGYAFGETFISDTLYKYAYVPIPGFVLLLLCLSSAIMVEHGVCQWLWGQVGRFSWRRLGCLILFCVPFIGLMIALELLHLKNDHTDQKTVISPVKPLLILDRFNGYLIQQSASVRGRNSMISLLVVHHFILPVYGLLAFMASEQPLFGWIAISTLGHGLLACCLYKLVDGNGQYRHFKMILIVASIIPIMPMAWVTFLLFSILHFRRGGRSLVGRVLTLPKLELPIYRLRERALQDWGHSTGQRLMHPRQPEDFWPIVSQESLMMRSACRILLALWSVQAMGFILLASHVLRKWVPIVETYALWRMFGIGTFCLMFLAMFWLQVRWWRRSAQRHLLVIKFDALAIWFFAAFVTMIVSSILAGFESHQFNDSAGIYIRFGGFFGVFILCLYHALPIQAWRREISSMAVFSLLLFAYIIFGYFLSLLPPDPMAFQHLAMDLAVVSILINLTALRPSLIWIRRRFRRTNQVQWCKLAMLILVMPFGVFLMPFLLVAFEQADSSTQI